MSISDSYFSEILSPYTKPKTLKALTNEGDLCTYKVLLNQNKKDGEFENDSNTPYLLISKQCFDHANTFVFIHNFYQQYHFSHQAIMPLYQLSISPSNSFEAYYKYPENGKLSDYIGFAHENILSESKELTPTQKSIISYGLAHALSYIHKHNYLFGEVNAKNVYLDEEFRPYLTNFYSIKKVNDQRVPKSKRLTDMHLKIDIYAYSIIYAALIEPISFDPPVKSTQEFFERLNNRKRPICNKEKTTEQQRELLSQMWTYIPRDRLSFDEIVEHFENGDLLFIGTNMDEFEKYKVYLNENQDAPIAPPLSPCSSSSHKNAPSSATVLLASKEALNEITHDDYESNQKDEEKISKPLPFNEVDTQDNPIQYQTRDIKLNLNDENEEETNNESNQQEKNDIQEEEEGNNESTNHQYEEDQNQIRSDEIREEEEEPEIENDTLDDNQQTQQKGDDIEGNDSQQKEIIADIDEQLHESDQDQEKGFNDWQPTEKNNYEDNQNVESNTTEENKNEGVEKVESKSNEDDQKSKNNEKTNEKKLNVLSSRHDDIGFKECDDDSESNHSYDQNDEDDNIISQTESVESDIQYLDVGGDNELGSD